MAFLRRHVLRIGQSVLLVAVGYYIFHQLQGSYTEIVAYEWKEQLRLTPLALSFTFLFAHFAWVGWLLSYIARACNVKTTCWEGIHAAIVSSLGKYLPGKIWATTGKVYLLRGKGSIVQLTYVVLLELALALASGVFVIFPLIVIYLLPISPRWMLASFLALGVPMLAGKVSWLLPLLRWVGVSSVVRPLPVRIAWVAFAGYTVSWGLLGAGFWCLVHAVYPVSFDLYPYALASMCGAWIIGFVSFLVPGGLGVREGVLIALGKAWLPVEIATVVSLAARLWTTIGELFALGFVLVVGVVTHSRRSKNTPSNL